MNVTYYLIYEAMVISIRCPQPVVSVNVGILLNGRARGDSTR